MKLVTKFLLELDAGFAFVERQLLLAMGVAEYKLLESWSPELQTRLPCIEQIERELSGDDKTPTEGETE